MQNLKAETVFACPLCGGKEFVEGFALGHAPLRFMPGSQGRLFKTLFSQGEKITTQKCASCGNLLLFAGAT